MYDIARVYIYTYKCICCEARRFQRLVVGGGRRRECTRTRDNDMLYAHCALNTHSAMRYMHKLVQWSECTRKRVNSMHSAMRYMHNLVQWSECTRKRDNDMRCALRT